jgi:hypothetical protein
MNILTRGYHYVGLPISISLSSTSKINLLQDRERLVYHALPRREIVGVADLIVSQLLPRTSLLLDYLGLRAEDDGKIPQNKDNIFPDYI